MRRELILTLFLLLLLTTAGLIAAQESGDWEIHQGEKSTLGTPTNWVNFIETPAVLPAGTGDSATLLAETISFLSPAVEVGLFDMVLIEPEAVAVVTVLATDLGTHFPLDEFEFVIRAQYESADVALDSMEIVELPVGEMLLVQVPAAGLPAVGGGPTFHQYQYFIFDDTELYGITFAADADHFEELLPMFEEMVETFTIVLLTITL